MGTNTFSVVQFNILAQFLTHPEEYPYAKPEALNWKLRFQRIRLFLAGFIAHGADIICLQEVQGTAAVPLLKDPNDHKSLLVSAVRELNPSFAALYCRKTGADGSSSPERDLGNLLLYRGDKFELLEYQNLAYARELGKVVKTAAQYHHYVTSYKQVAVVARLRHTNLGRIVCVAKTHSTSNYQNPDIQLAQVNALVGVLSSFKKAHEPVVVCGDFNSSPSSDVYHFLSKGMLPKGSTALKPKSTAIPSMFPDGLRHSLSLSSAYTSMTGSEPSFTNLKGPPENFMDCLDYVWHSQELLATAVLPTPPIDTLSKERGGLPNTVYPSDHIPIGATFAFADLAI